MSTSFRSRHTRNSSGKPHEYLPQGIDRNVMAKTTLEQMADTRHRGKHDKRLLTPKNYPVVSDIVIDDDIEGETLLGEGRAGVFRQAPRQDHTVDFLSVPGLQPKPLKIPVNNIKISDVDDLSRYTSSLKEDRIERNWKYGLKLEADKATQPISAFNQDHRPPSSGPVGQDGIPKKASEVRKTSATRTPKKTKTSKENDSVLNALAAIRNTRKRQPGATFLAYPVLPPTQRNEATSLQDIPDNTASRLTPLQTQTHVTNTFGKSSPDLPKPVRLKMNTQGVQGNALESKHLSQSRQRRLKSNSTSGVSVADTPETDVIERAFKRPSSEFVRDKTRIETDTICKSEKVATPQKGLFFEIPLAKTPESKKQEEEHDRTILERSCVAFDIAVETADSNNDLVEESDPVETNAKEDCASISSDVISEPRDSPEVTSPEMKDDRKSKHEAKSGSHGFVDLTAKESTYGEEYLVNDVTEAGESIALGTSPIRPMKPAPPVCHIKSTSIDMDTAINLKRIVIGAANTKFSLDWKVQSFGFTDLPGLQYGLVQKKSGPCGVMACVQAAIVRHLIFNQSSQSVLKRLQPSRKQRSEALAVAIATVLWRSGQKSQAVLALPSANVQFEKCPEFVGDGVTERLILNTATTFEDLRQFIQLNIDMFELDGSFGVILCLYSAILSRGFEKIREDMETKNNTLLTGHHLCKQELINLLLTGRAVSNVFNDTQVEESETGAVTSLKGLSERPEVGFLTLREHHKKCQVGTYYKVPMYPIWVLQTDWDYSVLFSLKPDLTRNWRSERRFDVYYYNCLKRYDHQVRLTIDNCNPDFRPPLDDDSVPPLELAIRTKWPDAEIDWNDTEPIMCHHVFN